MAITLLDLLSPRNVYKEREERVDSTVSVERDRAEVALYWVRLTDDLALGNFETTLLSRAKQLIVL